MRALNDYDAVVSDDDRCSFSVPPVSMQYDRTWALQWELANDDAGLPPANLVVEMTSCTSALQADGGCGAVTQLLTYQSGATQPWYSSSFSTDNILWSKHVTPDHTVITAAPRACLCFNQSAVTASLYSVRVSAVDRRSNAPLSYRLRQSLAPYPQSYAVDGGTIACPTVCGF